MPDVVKDYINKKITDCNTILDFGCGNGRLAALFDGKDVVGYDLVKRNPSYPMIDSLKGNYDAIVASKVLLHIPDISIIIGRLQSMSRRIVVWDAVGQDAPHVFDHDFSKHGNMTDIIRWNNEILFTYEADS